MMAARAGNPEEMPDRDLVRIHQNDPEGPAGRAAAEALFRRYRERVYIWCRRRLSDRELALDAAQETLLAAFRALREFEGRSEFATWLFAIARFRCATSLRGRQRAVFEDDVDLDAMVDPGAEVEERFWARESEESALALVREVLEPDEQTAIWMRCYEGTSVEEIGRALGATGASGARALLQRARRKLRAAVERGARA